MRIAFYGSSLLSSYWNGAATYYRGIIKALARLGHEITFYEPDVLERQAHADISPPDWCDVVVYPGTIEGLERAVAAASGADVVVKASGVGFEDERLMASLLDIATPDSITVFWDVDAPATLAEMETKQDHYLHSELRRTDLILTYGGGVPVVSAYRRLGLGPCYPIYNALDPETHFPVEPEARFSADLAFLGNRLPDREERVDAFFLEAARALPAQRFVLAGSGWGNKALPGNVEALGHLGTRDHNAFNCSPKAVLNISRDSMARMGFSPATRVFEAAGAGACLITDAWEGIEVFLDPDREVLVARNAGEVVAHLQELSPDRAREIGRAARNRMLREHTYAHRAEEVDSLFSSFWHKTKTDAAE